MNLTKLEKTFIIVLVVAGILAAGFFFFDLPAYNRIEAANKNLDKMKSERQEIEQQLAREATIDGEISDAKKEAEKMEGDFYPDLTTYEAVELTLAYLKACDMQAPEGITVSPMTTGDLALAAFTPTEVIYNLKTYAQTARGTDENALLEGEFLDKNKKYSIVVSSMTDVQITNVETGEAVAKNAYTDTMKDAYREAICRYADSNKLSQTIGATEVSFIVTGTYENYLKFIDYVFDIERATYMDTVIVPMTRDIEEEEGVSYRDEMGNVVSSAQAASAAAQVAYKPEDQVEQSVTFIYYSVEPMEALEKIDAAGVQVVVNQ